MFNAFILCTFMLTAGDLHELRKDYEAFQRIEKSTSKTKEDVLKNANVSSYDELVDKTKSIGERVGGFFTFVNIVQVSAALLIILAACWLFGFYFLGLILLVPVIAWEVILYLLSFTLAISGSYLSESYQLMSVLPGCMLFPAVLFLTLKTHFGESRDYEKAVGIVAALSFLVWLPIAVYYQSYVVAFMAVLALVNAIGFNVGVGPLCVFLGFEDDKAMVRGTFAGFVLLVIYCSLSLLHVQTLALTIFMPALHFVGAFVYFLGLLIMASKWYSRNWSYWPMQILTIASGIMALFLGSVFGMGSLLGIGGTFFAIYLIEKYIELSWNSIGIAWGLLGLGGLMYGFVYLARTYPQYFLF